jgi:N-glycosylase/DNA lyase
MVFCLCTPQSNAKSCFSAVTDLARSKILLKGDEVTISGKLRGYVRFHNNKSKYIIGARQAFSDSSGQLRIKEMLHRRDPLVLREWLVMNIKGLGYKEAGHFLRNIGRGENIAILDRHILRDMVRYHVIQRLPNTLTKRNYLDMENRLRGFSKRIGIPMAELDLLFWYRATGEIFK